MSDEFKIITEKPCQEEPPLPPIPPLSPVMEKVVVVFAAIFIYGFLGASVIWAVFRFILADKDTRERIVVAVLPKLEKLLGEFAIEHIAIPLVLLIITPIFVEIVRIRRRRVRFAAKSKPTPAKSSPRKGS